MTTNTLTPAQHRKLESQTVAHGTVTGWSTIYQGPLLRFPGRGEWVLTRQGRLLEHQRQLTA